MTTQSIYQCRFLIAVLAMAFLQQSCSTDQPVLPEARIPGDEVLYWNDKLETVLNVATFSHHGTTLGMTPPAQCRFFTIVQIAVHDALNAIEPKYESYAFKDNKVPDADPNAAVASASYWAIKKLGIEGAAPLEEWFSARLARIYDGTPKAEGLALGERAAEAIVALRADDNIGIANQQLPGPDGVLPGEYRSTLWFSGSPDFPKIKALREWGKVMKPFVITQNNQFRPAPPYSISSQEYEAEYDFVLKHGGATSALRTAEQEEITKFWVERTGTMWNRFARTFSSLNQYDAWATARLLAVLNAAMIDECSAGLEAKYHYFRWRPETAIRLSDNGNPNTNSKADWLPFHIEAPNADPARHVYCPMIPDYPAIHSGTGSAACRIMKHIAGSDHISFAVSSLTLPGVKRHYTRLSEAALDNTQARIFAGHYFPQACYVGAEMGEAIADYVFTHAFRKL